MSYVTISEEPETGSWFGWLCGCSDGYVGVRQLESAY